MGNLFRKPQDIDGSTFTLAQKRKFQNQWNGGMGWLRAMAIVDMIFMMISMVILFIIAAINSFSPVILGQHIVMILPFFSLVIVWVNLEIYPNKWQVYITANRARGYMTSLILTILHAAVLFIFLLLFLVIDVYSCGTILCSDSFALSIVYYFIGVLLIVQFVLDIISATVMIPRIGNTSIMIQEPIMVVTEMNQRSLNETTGGRQYDTDNVDTGFLKDTFRKGKRINSHV